MTAKTHDKVIFFDCDSTLSRVEGVDELARNAAPGVFEEVEKLTLDAMEGRVPIEAVFGLRLDKIRPGRREVDTVANQYLETLTPNVESVIKALQQACWGVAILSGGFFPAIEPLVKKIGALENASVGLHFDEQGHYAGYDTKFPTTRSGGKPEYLREWRAKNPWVKHLVMVGDGVSDLETRGVADLFIGYGGVVVRDAVRAGAEKFVMDHAEIPALLEAWLRKRTGH